MDQTEQVFPALTWGQKQIQFPKHCVLYFLEYRTMDKVQVIPSAVFVGSLREENSTEYSQCWNHRIHSFVIFFHNKNSLFHTPGIHDISD
jgi:hypothetical protein